MVSQEGRPIGVDGQVHQREGWAICWSADGLLVRLTTHTDINEAMLRVGRWGLAHRAKQLRDLFTGKKV